MSPTNIRQNSEEGDTIIGHTQKPTRGTTMERKYKPLRTYANLATIALVLYVILPEVLSLFATPEFLYYTVSLITAVVFLKWIFEASRNLPTLGATGQEFSSSWSVFWFFIPIANLVQPYRVMKEIWKGSHPNLEEGSLSAWRKVPASPLIIIWWTAWITYVITNRIYESNSPTGEATSIDLIVTYVPILAATTLAVTLIRKITSNQDKKYSTYSNQIQASQGSYSPEMEIIKTLTAPSEQTIASFRCKGGDVIFAVTDRQIIIAGENGNIQFSQPLSKITSVTRHDRAILIKDYDDKENRYEMGAWEEAQQLVSDIYNQKQKAMVKEETLDPQASQTME